MQMCPPVKTSLTMVRMVRSWHTNLDITQSEWEASSGNRVQKGVGHGDSWSAVSDPSDSTRSEKKWFISDFSKPIIPKAVSGTGLTFGNSLSITEDGYFIAVGSLLCTRLFR